MKNTTIIIVFFISVYSCSQTRDITKMQYPKIPTTSSISDNYFGTEVNDLFRNIEDLNDSVVIEWYKKQTILSDSTLNLLQGKKRLLEKLIDFHRRKSFKIYNNKTSNSGQYFYLKKEADSDIKRLYYRESFLEEEQLLFDPSMYNVETGNTYTINYLNPSWNGEFVAIALSHSGREFSEIIVIDVLKKTVLDFNLKNCIPASYGGVDWLPDNNGFTYIYFKDISKDYKKQTDNTVSVLFKLGQNPEDLNIILEKKDLPNYTKIADTDPLIDIPASNSKYALTYLISNAEHWDAYYANIEELNSNTIHWLPLFKEEDMIYRKNVVLIENTMFFKTAKGASNYCISKTNISEPNYINPTIVVREIADEVIDDFLVTSKGIVFTTLKNGVEAKLYLKEENSEAKEINLPKKSGAINIDLNKSNENQIWVEIKGWLNDEIRYLFDTESLIFEEQTLSPKGDYPEFSNFMVEEVLVKSHDGVEVPLSIIYNKNIVKESNSRVLIDAYGAYGYNSAPYFSTTKLSWVNEGGVYAVAHVRGGGEKGESWHTDGQKINKPNSWKDLIACGEYLISEKYTSKDLLAVYGASAGGIMVGGAVNERPDLFKAAMVQVGLMNPLRLEVHSKTSNVEEFGSLSDSLECKGLMTMDPYVNLRKDIFYPAFFLTTGMEDIRVPPWMSGKYTAKMQFFSKSNNPVLLRAKNDEGHNGGNKIVDLYNHWSEILSFALWQTGHPDYQPITE